MKNANPEEIARGKEAWDKKVKLSQELIYLMDTKTGKKVKRIPYGKEGESWGEGNCGDCGVKKGEYHVFECDIERSPIPGEEGQQLLMSERAGDFTN